MATKRELWLDAMRNVADRHHALIVEEYNRLCRETGVNLSAGIVEIHTWIHDWLAQDKMNWQSSPSANHSGCSNVGCSNAPVPSYTTRTIQCIKATREQFGLGLKESKDAVDTVRTEMIKAGEL